MNAKEISKIIEKIFFNEKIKENFIILHTSLIPFRIKSLKEVKLFWNILDKVIKNKYTVIMPSFSFNIWKKKIWDYKTTESEMGLLTEYFRKKIAVKRSIHPLHSITCYGPLSNKIPDHISQTSFGKKSTWEWLCKRKDVINISIGTGLAGGAAFVHYAEEMARPPYRKFIDLNYKVFDSNGKRLGKNYRFFGLKIANKNKSLGFVNYRKAETYSSANYWGPVEKDLINNSIMKKRVINKIIVTTKMNTYQATKFLSKRLKDNIFYMGSYKKNII